jgi:hypothetical protein
MLGTIIRSVTFNYSTIGCMLILYLQANGPIRHVETCPDFFFTARAHTTKSTLKILAANTHCKYFF